MKTEQSKNTKLGLFDLIGLTFGAIGGSVNFVNTVVGSLDDSAQRTASIISKGFDMADTIVDNSLANFANENLVEDAQRRIDRAQAEARAKEIEEEFNSSNA